MESPKRLTVFSPFKMTCTRTFLSCWLAGINTRARKQHNSTTTVRQEYKQEQKKKKWHFFSFSSTCVVFCLRQVSNCSSTQKPSASASNTSLTRTATTTLGWLFVICLYIMCVHMHVCACGCTMAHAQWSKDNIWYCSLLLSCHRKSLLPVTTYVG